MMKDYYHDTFRIDLEVFFEGSRVPYFGHAWSHNCGHQISKVPVDNRPAFLICLYFTVLVDQAMHFHFREHYQEFASLTKYPKFCHGLSQFHHNPRGILLAPIEQGVIPDQDVKNLIPAGMTLFVDEVVDFLQSHMPQIQPTTFFQALLYDPDVQIPLILKAIDPELKNDVVSITYDALIPIGKKNDRLSCPSSAGRVSPKRLATGPLGPTRGRACQPAL